jgi:hypothetical protein
MYENNKSIYSVTIQIGSFLSFHILSNIDTELAGCGDVVDFSKLTLGQLQGLGSIFK